MEALSQSSPTTEEAAAMLQLHSEYLTPCRKLVLQSAGDIHPALVTVMAESYARSDANYARLVTYKISWGEFVTEIEAGLNQRKAQLAQVGASIGKNLNQAHNAEVARYQAASAALAQWGYQQQVLAQNQQAINAMNRPRMTNCQYVGTYLSCTTF
jgi:hypothetical protein